MQTLRTVTVAVFLVLVTGMPGAALAQAAGAAPDRAICNDSANPPKDIVTQGACLATARATGNCQACHFIAGATSGNIAPPLVGLKQRFSDHARLRAQLQDATQINPRTVMPPYGRHEIMTPEEIDKVVAWLLTL